MVGRFFKDSAIYALANICARGLALVFVPFYVRVLDEGEIGAMDLLMAWGALATVIVGLEVSNGMARVYSEQKDDASRRRVASTTFWFSAAAYGMFLAVVAGCARPLAGMVLGDEARAWPVTAAAASVAAGGLFVVVGQQLRYLMKPKLFAITSIANVGVTLLTTIVCVSWFRLGITGVFLGTLTGLTVASVMAWRWGREYLGFTFDRACCMQMIKFSLPLVPSSIAAVVSVYAGRVAIDLFLTRDDVGVFGIAARLGAIITLVMAGFSNALTPLVYSKHEDKETPGHLASIFRIFAVIALAGSAGFLLFSREVLHLLTTPKYAVALATVMVMAPSVLLGQMYIFAPGAWIKKRTWLITGVNICAAALNVTLCWVLIPRAGMEGAAWAALGSGLASFSLNMILSQRCYHVPHQWGRLALALVLAGGCVAGGLIFGAGGPWTGLAARLAALVAALGCIWMVLGMPRREGPAAAAN